MISQAQLDAMINDFIRKGGSIHICASPKPPKGNPEFEGTWIKTRRGSLSRKTAWVYRITAPRREGDYMAWLRWKNSQQSFTNQPGFRRSK